MLIRDEAREEEVQVNMTPMIDMVFLLLIFFLVASTFSKQERQIAIHLPAAAKQQALTAPPKQIVINILAEGTVNVGGKEYDHAQLGALLKQSLGQDQERVVFIRADDRSRHGAFAAVVRVCQDAGVQQLKIGYAVSDKPE